MRRWPIVWFIAAAPFCCAQDPFDRVLQLSRIRHKMADALNRMPDYTCLVTIEREVQTPKDRGFKPVDTIRFEIAHAGDRELWAWPGATSFQDTPMTSMIPNGAFGIGDFALHARNIFVGGYSNMRFAGPVKLDGRPALRWDYDIPTFGSGWRIVFGQRAAVAGMSGSFWVDSESLDVLRLDMHAENLPSDFPMTSAVNTIHYARTKTGASFVQLPQSAVLLIRHDTGELRRNTTEFSHCRQYAGQSSISFDAKLPSSAGAMETPKIQEVELPAGLRVRIKLTSAIESSKAAVGDLVEGIVESDVSQNGNLFVPKGAAVTGRIRRVEKQNEGPYFTVGIEIDDIAYPEHHARFFGSLMALDPEPPGFEWFLGGERTEVVTQQDRVAIAGKRSVRPQDLPGVGTFFLRGSSFRIRAGTVLVWETRSL
ncbi:MAG TPA: hypothetical protein VGV35_14045 [Bryobacteraceae bacterium]|nr:hypothetical protein [Bryobacteraceae bacterium]